MIGCSLNFSRKTLWNSYAFSFQLSVCVELKFAATVEGFTILLTNLDLEIV